MRADTIETSTGGNRASLVLISDSSDRTFQIGRVLGDALKDGDCVALIGELGAGKTCLTQGIARGLGVPDRYAVTSPTFTLVNEYPGRRADLIHMDVYRLRGAAELEDLGYDEYLRGGGVMVIEWAEKVQEVLPAGTMYVKCLYLEDNKRKIEISGERNRIDVWERTLKAGGCW